MKNPHIDLVLQASLEQKHLEIDYESRSGASTRIIFPYGLSLTNGLWYCPSYCYKRQDYVSFRLDRMKRVNVLEKEWQGQKREMLTVREAMDKMEQKDVEKAHVFITFTKMGCKLVDPDPDFGEWIKRQTDGTGIIEKDVYVEDLSWIASIIIGLGKEAKVHQPEHLIQMIQKIAHDALSHYQ